MEAPSYYILCIPQQTRPDVLTKYPTSFIKQISWNFPFKFNNNKDAKYVLKNFYLHKNEIDIV
jgi:hypothetical protein